MWKERRVCAGLRQAMVAIETSQLHSRLFPDALIILWLMRPSGEALSLYLWKPSKWAHYDESTSKRMVAHLPIHHRIHFLSLLLPRDEEKNHLCLREKWLEDIGA